MQGQEVGKQYIQEPLQNPLGGGTSGDNLTIFEPAKPKTGNYYLNLTTANNNQSYNLDVYFYDRDANVNTSKKELAGNVSLKIYFDKENSINSYVEEI